MNGMSYWPISLPASSHGVLEAQAGDVPVLDVLELAGFGRPEQVLRLQVAGELDGSELLGGFGGPGLASHEPSTSTNPNDTKRRPAFMRPLSLDARRARRQSAYGERLLAQKGQRLQFLNGGIGERNRAGRRHGHRRRQGEAPADPNRDAPPVCRYLVHTAGPGELDRAVRAAR
jgi:hypothetical protein